MECKSRAKNGRRQPVQNCSLVQTDICTAFKKWRNSANKMNNKKKSSKIGFTSPIIIEIDDSDSEGTVDPANGINNIVIKRELSVPFSSSSSDEDEEEKPNVMAEAHKAPEMHAPTTPVKIVQMMINKPGAATAPIHPAACSTPLVLNSKINITHVGINELSTILNDTNDAKSECGSVSSISTESTIMYDTEHSSSKPNPRIEVRENLIIRMPIDKPNRANTIPATDKSKQQSDTNVSTNNPSVKRVSQSERTSKQLKIDPSSKEQTSVQLPQKVTSKNKENKQQNDFGQSKVSKETYGKGNGAESKLNGTKRKLSYSEAQNNQNSSRSDPSVKKKISCSTDVTRCLSGSVQSSSDEQNRVVTAHRDKNVTEKDMAGLKEKVRIPKPKKSLNGENEPKWLSKKVQQDKSEPKNKDSGKCKQAVNSRRSQTSCSILPEKTNNISNTPSKIVKHSSDKQNHVITTPNDKNVTEKIIVGSKTKELFQIPKKTVNGEGEPRSLDKNIQSDKPGQTPNFKDSNNMPKSSSSSSSVQPGSSKSLEKSDKSSTTPSKPIECANSSEHATNNLVGQHNRRNANLISKKEGKQVNLESLKLITDLFKTVYETRYLRHLVIEDKGRITVFFRMKRHHQYACLKLFTRQRRWYNIFKFCKLINLDMSDSDVCDLYNVFQENQIVDTDYSKVEVIELLNLLDRNDLKSICDNFKLQKSLTTTKEVMIRSLLNRCRTQSTLTNQKSTQDLIKEQITQKMGKSIRINENFYYAFYRTYILGTFTNPAFATITDYFANMLQLRILFPKYDVHDYLIFYTPDEFKRFARAKRCRDELEKYIGRNHLETLKICRTMFEELVLLKDIENHNDDRYRDAPHLIRFTARAVYVSGLSSGIKILATKFPYDVKEWLEYMIENESKYTHRIGEWYYHLSWLYMKYLEPHDYAHAAKLIIKVLQEESDHLSKVQFHQLGKRGEMLKVTKKYKIDQWYHDTIAELVPRPIDVDKEIPQCSTDARAIRDNESGIKRGYVVQDNRGNPSFLSVENIALGHYITERDYTDGEHCEGSLIKAMFALFFWDIIYMHKPASFVSKEQSVPLDMNTKYFYLRRKDEIDKRLKEIESVWPDSEVVKRVKYNYDQHSHESGIFEVGRIIKQPELLEVLIDCVGRKVLAKICERLVKNIRHYRSGMPDLLVWNADKKKSKFVEVKGENDTLSVGQTLWLKYLLEIGADAEVCHVHTMGSKRKKIAKNIQNKDLAGPSTSCSNANSLESKKKKQDKKKKNKEIPAPSTPSSSNVDAPSSKKSKSTKRNRDTNSATPSTSSSGNVHSMSSKGNKNTKDKEPPVPSTSASI